MLRNISNLSIGVRDFIISHKRLMILTLGLALAGIVFRGRIYSWIQQTCRTTERTDQARCFLQNASHPSPLGSSSAHSRPQNSGTPLILHQFSEEELAQLEQDAYTARIDFSRQLPCGLGTANRVQLGDSHYIKAESPTSTKQGSQSLYYQRAIQSGANLLVAVSTGYTRKKLSRIPERSIRLFLISIPLQVHLPSLNILSIS